MPIKNPFDTFFKPNTHLFRVPHPYHQVELLVPSQTPSSHGYFETSLFISFLSISINSLSTKSFRSATCHRQESKGFLFVFFPSKFQRVQYISYLFLDKLDSSQYGGKTKLMSKDKTKVYLLQLSLSFSIIINLGIMMTSSYSTFQI